MTHLPRADTAALLPSGVFARIWYDFFREVGRKTFESLPTAITSGTVTILPHGLAFTPIIPSAYLINVTPQFGFLTGEIVPSFAFEDANDYGIQLSADATSIYVIVGANGIRIMQKTGSIGQFATITNANWSIVVTA